MSLTLSSPITNLKGIGPAKAKFLNKLGINHIRDFIFTFPRRHEDFSNISSIVKLKPGQTMTVLGRVKKVKTDWGWQGKRRLLRIFVDLEDDTGIISVTWYNLRFLPRQLWQGREIYVSGKVEENPFYHQQLPINKKNLKTKDHKPKASQYRLRSPTFEFKTGTDQTHTARIAPIYPETFGITSRFLRYQIKNLLPLIEEIPEYIPADIRQRNKLISIHEAIKSVHFPDNSQKLKNAQRRLRFDELFFLQLSALVRRNNRDQQKALSITDKKDTIKKTVSSLPYKLTKAQQTALKEIIGDLKKKAPMNRLLQGDVGSGKSVIALIATHLVLSNKKSVLYLAPTEILARQQTKSFRQSLGQKNIALLIGAATKKEKDKVKKRLSGSAPLCVVGTHALLQKDVVTNQCALVIIDEQHRFGVAQRKTLRSVNKTASSEKQLTPHLLSMTATPIPRTLNLTVYGDLDVSVLDELPPGRQKIITKLITPADRDQAILHILEELHAGRQAYVIAPLIEQSNRLQVKSTKETFAEMRKLFPDIAVGLLHGQMTAEEKDSVARNFSAGAIQLLVSTSVVEVGIDIPNATIMVIEGAERFGLAQLHQLRGRVGRGGYQSYCYLFPSPEAPQTQRLKTLTETTDGFLIAEKDLELRGPGEIYGVAQSGFGDLKVASLLDYKMIKLTRAEAEQLLQQDPQLEQHPILRLKVERKNVQAHFE